MIEINLIRKRKTAKIRPPILIGSLAAILLIAGFGMRSGGDGQVSQKISAPEKTVAKRKLPAASRPEVKPEKPRKTGRSSKIPSFKMAAFVSVTDGNFAMLVRKNRVRWVAEGEKISGLKISEISEEGTAAEKISGAGETVFFPLRK